MKNNFKIIDSHCHIYPERIAHKAAKSISEFYDGMPILNDGSIGRLLSHGKVAGVDRFVVTSVAATPERVTAINRFIADAVSSSDGLLIGLGALHPDGTDIEGDIKLIKSLHLSGVKLHADIQKIAIDDPRCFKIYEILAHEGLPVLMHTGDSRYNFSNPDNLLPVLKAFKNLTVIGAHYGGWSVWEEAAAKLSKFENLYVDTSSTLGFTSFEFVKNLLPKFDPSRILFGTDYPTWDAGAELDALFSLNLPDNVLRGILHDNCARAYFRDNR
ncbi:MAG: amidohydrolase family protein [Firmicutes bacterium]|nr:amidohydrolase family protein [Bacillota bacterium]